MAAHWHGVKFMSLNEIYSCRFLNKKIRRTENRLAVDLSMPRLHRAKLENDLEWLLTWSIKRVSGPDYLWCDGAKGLQIVRLSKRGFSLDVIVLIGPESDVSQLHEATLQGVVLFSSHVKKLKEYELAVRLGSSEYVVSKKT